jgi:hypothetical protein
MLPDNLQVTAKHALEPLWRFNLIEALLKNKYFIFTLEKLDMGRGKPDNDICYSWIYYFYRATTPRVFPNALLFSLWMAGNFSITKLAFLELKVTSA